MLDYAEYLALKRSNPNEKCYIENLIYEIGDSQSAISMWNGYELESVFDIKAPNIKEIFSEDQWNEIINHVKESRFWLDNWRYSDAVCKAFANEGVLLKPLNNRPSLEEKEKTNGILKRTRTRFAGTYIGYSVKRLLYIVFQNAVIKKVSTPEKLFYATDEDIYGGHFLKFQYKGNGIDNIDADIRQAFKFSEITDDKNLVCLDIINSTNSVSIHARRGDMLGINKYCYEYGYFKRAVKFIKRKVADPVFFFFCDPGSVEWCRENYDIFGLDKNEDTVNFVDWNKGNQSYRDMQLMSKCKHNIITTSSFGWWGAYLNENPNKITCSPDIRINTTNSF
ncbi:MAG: alpha-1,2-fucosyltransferase [Sedimentibacter sp.]|uniref:alpha-1,2-fucosyltransferase n=1 Tax=Sedimentibacter sp. TaxID=1960295 RepID=UPI0031583113